MSVRRNDLAPSFQLAGTDGTDAGRRIYALEEFRGHPVVLVFYPGDDTPVCTSQLNRYTKEFPSFAGVGATVLALSPQSVDSHERFVANQGGFAFPLLADPDKAVGEAYGVVGPLGFYRRSTFVVDTDGVIRWVQRSITGLTFPSSADLVEAVAAAIEPPVS